MGKKSRAQRRARRRYVNKNRAGNPTGIVKPSPLAEAKKRPWPLQQLLQRGPEKGGIDAQLFESALLIVETFKAITRSLGYRSNALSEQRAEFQFMMAERGMTAAQARRAMIYFAWANDVPTWVGVPASVIVEWIEDLRPMPLDAVPLLVRAIELWDKHAAEATRTPLTEHRVRVQLDFGGPKSVQAPPPLPRPAACQLGLARFHNPGSSHAATSTAAPRAVAPRARRA